LKWRKPIHNFWLKDARYSNEKIFARFILIIWVFSLEYCGKHFFVKIYGKAKRELLAICKAVLFDLSNFV
jgi:hypothetical protein